MKVTTLNLLAIGVAGLLVSAVAQDVPPGPPPGGDSAPPADAAAMPQPPSDAAPATPDTGGAPAAEAPQDAAAPPAADTTSTVTVDNGNASATNEPVNIQPRPSSHPSATVPAAEPAAPVTTVTNGPDDIQLNFHNAPLEMVLNYLSDAADFVIVLETRVNGNVSVKGSHLTRDEVTDLLNAELNKNGYAAIRSGRTLTIVDKNEAKTSMIPVKTGNNPDQIPKNAEIVTQIIPIRFVEARQLVSDLTSFVSPQATVVANEAGNSIVITDTQQNIKHLTEIIKAIDDSAQSETEIRVFHLKHASPADVASELGSIFPSSGSSGGNTQSPIRFGGAGGGGPGGFFQRMMGGGNTGGSGGNSSSDRIKKATQVSAVADSRIQAVIVTAPKDLMDQIAGMMTELDVSSTRDQNVFVFHMNNADPQQAVQVLQNMFQTSGSRSSSSSSSTSTLQKREQNNTTATSSSGSTTSSSFGTGSGTGRGGTTF